MGLFQYLCTSKLCTDKNNIIMMKLKTRVIREIVDPETGILSTIEDSKIFTGKIKEDAFYMTFIQFASPLFSLKSASAQNLLVWLCNHAEYNTGRISLSAGDRMQILKDCDIRNNNTITNNLKILKDKGLIEGGHGIFFINPEIFWKGDLNIRRKMLENGEFCFKFTIKPIEKETNNNENNGDN